MRLIDADVLLRQIKATSKDSGFYRPLYDGFAETVNRCPTIEAEPVRHGRWEMPGDDDDLSCCYFCSQCGYNMDESEYLDNFSHFKYCPHCGAKMDGETA